MKITELELLTLQKLLDEMDLINKESTDKYVNYHKYLTDKYNINTKRYTFNPNNGKIVKLPKYEIRNEYKIDRR